MTKKSNEKKPAKKTGEKKPAKKTGEKKITIKTQTEMEAILTYMAAGEWYRLSDLMDILELKKSRTRELLRFMVDVGKIIDDGATKGKRYKKVD